MEEQIKKIYSKMRYMVLKGILVGLLCVATLTILISFVEGNPFPYGNGTTGGNGWILEKTYLWFWVAMMSVMIERYWVGKYIKSVYQPFASLLEDKCDPVALRWGTQYAVGYGVQNKEFKTSIYYFEHLYILSLNGLGEFEEAIRYLENSWISTKQKKIRERWLLVAKLNDASEKKQLGKYMKIWEQLPPVMQKNMEAFAQMLLLKGEYEEALKIFTMMKGRTLFAQVSKHSGLAECYMKMGNIEAAKEHLKFARDHGNTSMYKKNAIRDLEILENIGVE